MTIKSNYDNGFVQRGEYKRLFMSEYNPAKLHYQGILLTALYMTNSIQPETIQ